MDTPPAAPSSPPPPRAPQRSHRGCLWAFLAVAILLGLGLVGLMVAGAVTTTTSSSSTPKVQRSAEQGSVGFGSQPYLAVIEIAGPIMDSEDINRLLKVVAEEDHCQGLLLEVDSPGGGVTASDEIWNAVKEVQEAGKPVVVYMGSLAASGGYYVSAPADWIVASPTTLTGSIGVIIQAPAYKEGLNRIGVSMRTFTSGENKAMLSPTEDMSEEQRALVQGLVDESYDRFVGVVAEGRGLDEEALRNGVADGRIVSGQQALDYGLVDQLAYRGDALELALERAGLGSESNVVKLTPEMSFGDLIGIPLGKVEVELGPDLGLDLRAGLPYYLSPVGWSEEP